MQIGVVAKRVGLSVDAIRFYERNACKRRRTGASRRSAAVCRLASRRRWEQQPVLHNVASVALGVIRWAAGPGILAANIARNNVRSGAA